MADNIQILHKNELDKILSDSGDDKKKLDLIIKFCRDNYNITHDVCQEYADAGLLICDSLKLSSQKNILNTYIAFFLWHKNEPQKALSLIHSFSDQLLESKSYLEYSLGVIICSLIEWSRGNVELAFNSINLAFDSLVDKKNTKFAIIRLHWTLGVIYFDLDEIEDSYYHYQFCKDSLSNETDYSMVAYINVGLASVLKKRNELKKAADLFEETLEYSTKHNVWMVEARAWHELGLLEMIHKRYIRATELILNSIKIREENNAIPALVSSMISLAEIDVALKKYSAAVEKLSEVLEICEEKKLKPKATLATT